MDQNTPNSDDFPADLAAAKSGDRDALGRLMVRILPTLTRTADANLGQRLRARIRASDVVQNAFLDVLADLGDFQGETEVQFVAWVKRVLERGVHRQNRHFTAQKRAEPERTSAVRRLAREMGRDEVPTPSHEVADQEERELLRQAIGRLKDDYRTVLTLTLLEGKSHAEAGEVLGRDGSALRMLLARARAALALEVERMDKGAGDAPAP